jgi:hypothetical protein
VSPFTEQGYDNPYREPKQKQIKTNIDIRRIPWTELQILAIMVGMVLVLWMSS